MLTSASKPAFPCVCLSCFQVFAMDFKQQTHQCLQPSVLGWGHTFQRWSSLAPSCSRPQAQDPLLTWFADPLALRERMLKMSSYLVEACTHSLNFPHATLTGMDRKGCLPHCWLQSPPRWLSGSRKPSPRSWSYLGAGGRQSQTFGPVPKNLPSWSKSKAVEK